MGRIKDMHEDERPRERLVSRGAASLSASELIAILLRVGVRGKSAVALGEELLQRSGGLEGLARLSVADITGIHGLGVSKAAQLKAAFELASRMAAERVRQLPMDTPQQVVSLLGDEMRQLDVECLRIILVGTRLKLKAVEEVSRGTINETVAHPRDILRCALIHRAYGFIMVHNHPSGDPHPSQADLEFTRLVLDAARLMQVVFLDHIILGSPDGTHSGYYSFKESGYL
ncbi:MAG: DNA repair protein RadC [Candidatus Methylacidiphilales bacterium]